MRRAFTLAGSLALALALAAQGACRRAPAPVTLASGSASASSAAASSAAPSRDFPPDEQELDAASGSALALGPLPQAAASGERAERLRSLFRGQLPAARLPLVETDQGVAFSRNLYSSLTTEVTHRGGGLSDMGKATATLSPPVVLAGELDIVELTQRLNVMGGAFRRCYQRALLDDPKLQGKVTLLFVVEREGAVSSVAVESAPPRSRFLQDCLKARAQGQLFSGISESSQAKFRLQVAFKPDEP